jgi:tape measure domain-containing protein
MAAIRTAIELQDNFTNILYHVIDSVNLGLSAMEDLHHAMNSSVDTASFDGARSSINQATISVQELVSALQDVEASNLTPTAPVPSVQWQSDSLDAFTGSGAGRFRQEVQSANAMLEQLSTTQDAIAKQAYNTNILPPAAFQDLNSMAVRIDNVRNRIQTIENNPLNLGTDTANAELEQLRGQLNQAIQEQQNLNHAVGNMDVQAANESYLRLSQTIGSTERYIRDNVDEQGRFNQEISQGTDKANELIDTIKGAVAAYATLQTAGKVLNLSDTMAQTQARLSMLVDVDDGGSIADLQNIIFLSAERARGDYQQTAEAVSKLGLMAGDAFSGNEEIIAFTEQLNKQFAIAGTEAAGIDAAMLQLTQAMGSGVLRGEEYNSILEQAPNIIQAIADYMNVPMGKLKDMASEGEITAEIVKMALFDAADETNAKFDGMSKTFEQVWTSFQNHALMAFQPVLEQINALANSEAFQVFMGDAVGALSVVAGLTLEIFDLLVGVAGAVAGNWSWLSPIIYGVAGALAVYYGWLLLSKGAALATAAAQGALTLAKMLAVPIYAALTGATMADAAAQWGLNSAMYACPIVWIIILIIALIALFYAAVAAVNKFAGTSASATGMICGAFMVALAFIGNIFIALWNLVVDVFVLIYNLVATVANFIGNVFTDPIGAVCRLFFDLADTVLGILQALASAIDAIFGSNLAGAVSGWRDFLGSWVDDTFGKGNEIMEKMNADDMKAGRLEYGNAWDAGYSFGEGVDESISNFDPSSLFDTNIPNPDDYSDLSTFGAGGAIDGIGSGVDDIAGNTGAIADSMDIAEEELKYMRDLAEQETVNRFTTAEIIIDQSGMQNTINSGNDMNGFMTKLTDSVNEAIDSMTEGVHV